MQAETAISWLLVTQVAPAVTPPKKPSFHGTRARSAPTLKYKLAPERRKPAKRKTAVSRPCSQQAKQEADRTTPKVCGGQIYTQPARGLCDGLTIPATAQAVVGNTTVVFPIGGGYLTLCRVRRHNPPWRLQITTPATLARR